MIQVEQRLFKFNQLFCSYQVTMSLEKSIPHQATLTVSLKQTQTQNHYLGQFTFQTLQPLVKRHFQNIQSLYNKFYDSIKKNDGTFTIEPNGRLHLIHQGKGQQHKCSIIINTKLIQMNRLTDVDQAIELLFSKSKQNQNLVFKMKQLIMNEVKDMFKKQQNQPQFKRVRQQAFQLKRQVFQHRKQPSQQSSLLQKQNFSVQQQLSKIKQQVSSIQKQISSLRQQISKQSSSIQQKISQQVFQLRKQAFQKISRLRQQTSKLRQQFSQFKGQKSSIRQQGSSLRKQISQQIASVRHQVSIQPSSLRQQICCIISSIQQQIYQLRQQSSQQVSSIQRQIFQQIFQLKRQISSVRKKISQQAFLLRQQISLQVSKLERQICFIRNYTNKHMQQTSSHKQQIGDIKKKLVQKSEKRQLDEQVFMLNEKQQNNIVVLNKFIEAHYTKNNRQLEQANKILQTLKQEIKYIKIKLQKVQKLLILQLKNIDPQQLKKQIVRYSDFKFDQVCVSNDRFHTALNDIETIRELGNLKNVIKLDIKWCKQMKAQVSMEILNTMPHLKQLALLNHYQKFSQNFIKKLCQFKQLAQFYTHSNSHPEYYRNISEDLWFIDFFSLEEDNLRQIEELMELSKLPKLQNIQISLVNDTNSAQVIKNMKSLRHLTLGYNQWNNHEVNIGLMQQLCEQRALITLSLIGVKVESKKVSHIIKSNLYLKTIIIRNTHHNDNINDGTVECMANLIQLQNLCIHKNRAITGKHLNKLHKLIMLEINDCRNVSKKQMKEAITKMQNLEHFNISQNKWFDNEIVTSIQSCEQLVYLNVYGTSISCEGIKHLKGLTRLNILICGKNKINGKDLIELTKQTAKITRLSIMGLNVNDDELLQISENCQTLTHLDIRGAKIAAETLLKIKQIKVVKSSLTANCKKKLRKAGIQTYQ